MPTCAHPVAPQDLREHFAFFAALNDGAEEVLGQLDRLVLDCATAASAALREVRVQDHRRTGRVFARGAEHAAHARPPQALERIGSQRKRFESAALAAAQAAATGTAAAVDDEAAAEASLVVSAGPALADSVAAVLWLARKVRRRRRPGRRRARA